MSENIALMDLVELLGLELGQGPWTVQISESTLNLLLCAISPLDDRIAWLSDGQELDDAEWDVASEMLSLAQWELETEAIMGGVYVDRGDPQAWDATIGAGLTADGNWNVLDLSAIVTDAEATLVHLLLSVKDGSTNKTFQLRKNGNTGGYNILIGVTQVTNLDYYWSGFCAMDTARKVAYYISTGMDVANLVVRGWWKPA